MAATLELTEGWQLLRTKTGFVADDDYVDLQSVPDLVNINRKTGGTVGHGPIGAAIVVVWIDDGGEVLDPDAGADRGEFDLTLLEAAALEDDDTPPDAATVIMDSSTLTTCVGYRKYLIDGVYNSRIGVRLTNITEPAAGNPTKIQVWIKAQEGG